MCSIIILLLNIDQYCEHFYSPLNNITSHESQPKILDFGYFGLIWLQSAQKTRNHEAELRCKYLFWQNYIYNTGDGQ